MKIKIKSREEIEKTLDGSYHELDRSYFSPAMFELCDTVLEVVRLKENAFYSVSNNLVIGKYPSYCWHPDWYEVVDDFTQEDLMDIELMDEMLNYFLGEK